VTAHEAAHRLPQEAGKPQSSRVRAERMLKRGMLRSNASEPRPVAGTDNRKEYSAGSTR
jgi:hypothetical protein